MKRGPKPILNTAQKYKLGARCEAAWREIAEREASKSRPEEIDVIQKANRTKKWKYEVQLGANEIDRLLFDAGLSEPIKKGRNKGQMSRLVSMRVRRPYNAADQVLEIAVAWCWRAFRRRITQGYARDCWDLARQRHQRLARDLNS